MSGAQRLVKRNLSTESEVEQCIVNLQSKYLHTGDAFFNRTCFIVSTETLLRYRHLIFDCEQSAVWQKRINALINKLMNIETGHLGIYCEHLRKKLDKVYRLDAQKKYILFYFKGIFGIDIATIITGFVQ